MNLRYVYEGIAMVIDYYFLRHDLQCLIFEHE